MERGLLTQNWCLDRRALADGPNISGAAPEATHERTLSSWFVAEHGEHKTRIAFSTGDAQ